MTINYCVFIGTCIAAAAHGAPPSPASSAEPRGRWAQGFSSIPGLDGDFVAMTRFDDGKGDALYVVKLSVLSGSVVSEIAKWNGFRWSVLESSGIGGTRALTVFDDGNGPAIYAGGVIALGGGSSAYRVVKWDGRDWSAIGSAFDSSVLALAVFDDGSGPALVAAGSFQFSGSDFVGRVAKWNGSNWSPLGPGLTEQGGSGSVLALCKFDDGSGPALYAGGNFTAYGTTISRIAKWDGTVWSPLGSGISHSNGTASVGALEVFDDGSGPALFAGGSFTAAGGVNAIGVAKWDGTTWSSLGSGIRNNNSTPSVRDLVVFDDGNGPSLFVGGQFNNAGGTSVLNIAKWNGQSWSALGNGPWGPVYQFDVFNDGHGPALIVGGYFGSVGGTVGASNVAKWNGVGWSPLGEGFSNGISAMTVLDAGCGPELFVGGAFLGYSGDPRKSYIARWSGLGWTGLITGMDGSVEALTVFDDGHASALYAGGYFRTAGGKSANRIAKWHPGEPGTWSPLGSGVVDASSASVHALAVFDDGDGSALFAGGHFDTAGNVVANNIAMWDGEQWSALGSGTNDDVSALVEFDDGNGPSLYAGGYFTTAGGISANRIAKWNGENWAALGSGLTNGSFPAVHALSVFDDGSGAALYVGGTFTTAGGASSNYIAKWNGTSWSSLSPMLAGTSLRGVFALRVFDDGRGPALYVGGSFTAAGDVRVNGIARWDGTSWSPLATGIDGDQPGVNELAVHDDGSGPSLFAAGLFKTAGGNSSPFIAKWTFIVDWRQLSKCFGGPGYEIATDCRESDLDFDNDVDLTDIWMFQSRFTP